MPDSAALIAHIVSQTRQNVEFLISQNELSRDAGRDILSKLPSANDHSIMALSDATRRMTIPEPSSSPAHTHNMPMPGGMMNSAVSTPQGPPPGRVNSPGRSSYSSPPPHQHHGHAPPPDFGPPVRRGVPPPGPKVVRAKALWSYNENGQDPNDLSFQAGDIIEIVTETNADWWTGKIGGRQGLFPSNYVEKLDSSAPAPAPAPSYESRSPSYNSPAPPGSYNSYNNAPVPYQGPPPPQQVQGYNPYMNGPGAVQQAPPPQQQVVVQQEQPPQKESKYGGLKQTLATSAVGGVGFGAGSAIGSGLINSIF